MSASTATPLRPTDIEFKSAAVTDVGGGAVVTEDPYVFDILASVTGIPDEVMDIIEPGAYTETLAKRTPKVIKDHDWAQRIGKVLSIKELHPGDPELPKLTARGEPWPTNAGALRARVRLFKGTKGGEEARVRWAEYGPEQEFSIGYAVPKGTSRKDGPYRRLPKMNLFELSDVLFGAMPLAGVVNPALATKMLAAVEAEDEAAAKSAAEAIESTDPGAGVEPAPRGDGPRTPEQALADLLATKAAFAEIEAKYDTSPIGEPGNRENWVDKAGGLPSYIRAIAHALIREGKSESSAIAIAVGMVKKWASGGGEVTPKVRAKAAAALAQWEKMKAESGADTKTADGGYDPALEHGPFAGCLAPAGDVESKSYPNLPGTVEERMEALREALWEAFRGAPRDVPAPTGDPVPQPITANGGSGRYEWDHISIVGTWADRVVFTRLRWNGDGDNRESWEVPYTYADDGAVTFAEPTEVRLEINTVPATPPADEADPAAVDPAAAADGADDPSYVEAGLWVGDLLAKATSLAVLALPAQPQTKAGRVLSGTNAGRLRTAVETLLQVLRDAGIDVPTDTGVTDDELAATHLDETLPDSTAPSAQRRTPGELAGATKAAEVHLDPVDYGRALALLAAVGDD